MMLNRNHGRFTREDSRILVLTTDPRCYPKVVGFSWLTWDPPYLR